MLKIRPPEGWLFGEYIFLCSFLIPLSCGACALLENSVHIVSH